MIGDTKICRWKDDKRAAYSFAADDSTNSQLYVMAPELKNRGFTATFFINPGHGAHPSEARNWIRCKDEWMALYRDGFDFAVHTMHHHGAKDEADAQYEIGECARYIREMCPNETVLLFLRGGATDWAISEERIVEIGCEHNLVAGRGGCVAEPAWRPSQGVFATEDEITRSVDIALETGSWRCMAMHGVGTGNEWLTIDTEPYIALLDKLYENRHDIWVETNTKIHKYMNEYAHAKVKTEVCEKHISVTLTHDHRPELYDYPLTLKTEVPGNWENCVVIQGDYRTSRPVRNGVCMYNAVPNKGEVKLERFDSYFSVGVI